MAKRKIRPHPGALDEFLKRQNMTQTEAAAASGIDRKTLAKINRGEDVKEDTLQKLAKKLNVPSTYFEPPADDTSRREASQPDNPRFHNLMLRKVDAEGLAKVPSGAELSIGNLTSTQLMKRRYRCSSSSRTPSKIFTGTYRTTSTGAERRSA